MAIDVAKTCNECLSVVFFELMETTSIENATQHGVHIERFFMINWNNSIQIVRFVKRSLGFGSVLSVFLIVLVHLDILTDRSSELDSMSLVIGKMI